MAASSSLFTRVLVFFLLFAMLAISANAQFASGTGLPVTPTTNSTTKPTYTTPAVPTGTSDQRSSANTLSSTVALFGALIAGFYSSTACVRNEGGGFIIFNGGIGLATY
ncbi:hypothetical protein L873DRAFT_1794431 [Choiromyces venosus 120613-1]|uniref:Uncharacterized protein n=1 Tax=Choiromyces venosus 120613-1 TaxID=1336337 RepID=A0A3N4J4J3_9PEZI|nr:hypothetical protein L873DRAFT_1794431 [Choiromyces venosus 120613-1]